MWFNFAFYILILIVGLIILAKSSNYLVTTISRLGHLLHFSQFITGFILLGIGTSIPEIFVAISSAASHTPELSYGNLIGANITLFSFVAGFAAIVAHGIHIKKDFFQPGKIFQVAVIIFTPIILLVDFHLSRFDAILAVFLYFAYLLYIFQMRPIDSPPLEEELMNHHFLHTLLISFTGLLGVIISSQAVVFSAHKIAQILLIPDIAIGTLLLGFGTNLPEISVLFASVRLHKTNLVMGDIVGSAATNTFILGLLGLLSPFTITSLTSIETAAIFIPVAMGLFFFFTKSKNTLTPREGAILLAVYIAYIITTISTLYLKI